MNSFVLALRAIGTSLAMRLYVPAVIVAAVAIGAIIALGVWLTTLSGWWWLLFVPITILASVVAGIAFVVFMLIRSVRPPLTTSQKRATTAFVDRLQGIADIAGTPKFVVLFRVVRSVASPKKDTYLSDLVSNKQLASEFRELQRSFDDVIVVE